MLLVVDSGSTKADWAFCSPDGTVHMESSLGVNPNVHSTAEITTVLESVCPVEVPEAKVTHIHYYGTGIWDAKRGQKIKEVLQAIYVRADIEVHHDLLGAARAACQAEPGIACILGTGSNTCLYDGSKVTDNVKNLGWLLGDEGSGVDIGKRLVRAYCYRELPREVESLFEESTGHNRKSIGDSLYGPSHANRFLASFSPFVHDNLDVPEIRQLVVEAFTEFLRRHVMKYRGYESLKVSFVGSIAHHYDEVLREVCAAHDITCGGIRQKPIDPLVEFHRRQHSLTA